MVATCHTTQWTEGAICVEKHAEPGRPKQSAFWPLTRMYHPEDHRVLHEGVGVEITDLGNSKSGSHVKGAIVNQTPSTNMCSGGSLELGLVALA